MGTLRKIDEAVGEVLEDWIQSFERRAEKRCDTFGIDYENANGVEKTLVTATFIGELALKTFFRLRR